MRTLKLFCNNTNLKSLKKFGEFYKIRFTKEFTLNSFFEFKNAKQYWGVGHMMEIENFYTSLSEGKKPKNSVDEVLDTHHLIDAIYKSGKENRKIVL